MMYSEVAGYKKVMAEGAAEAARWKRLVDLLRSQAGSSPAPRSSRFREYR